MSQHDDINSPSHYDIAPGIEAWDVIRAVLTPEELRGYCLGNVLKYRLRAGEKEGQDPEKCLAKARWYRERLMELEEKRALSKEVGALRRDLQRLDLRIFALAQIDGVMCKEKSSWDAADCIAAEFDRLMDTPARLNGEVIAGGAA